jgi:hypothetical protein
MTTGKVIFVDDVDAKIHAAFKVAAARDSKTMSELAKGLFARYLLSLGYDVDRGCRVCGCTDWTACEGGCGWVDDDLCTACAAPDAV